ncbi:hypothetical protein BDV33DRAFT_117066 [Aspergillus novoparasiticus]|uniref:Uncharacterized protein n=1 Tax=Aspergillus novoparasiticus TaxID=986946 RepID=A0A5N6EQB1_9EURO|nr:hypothetical protein BDV33DRAFT_117066 [Aspergillus novoparasiticus]
MILPTASRQHLYTQSVRRFHQQEYHQLLRSRLRREIRAYISCAFLFLFDALCFQAASELAYLLGTRCYLPPQVQRRFYIRAPFRFWALCPTKPT